MRIRNSVIADHTHAGMPLLFSEDCRHTKTRALARPATPAAVACGSATSPVISVNVTAMTTIAVTPQTRPVTAAIRILPGLIALPPSVKSG